MKRVVFFRSGAIGDIIHCLPAIKLAKEENPDVSIELVIASKQVHELLDYYCPYVDKIYTVPRYLPQSEELLKSLEKNSQVEPGSQIDSFVYLHSNTWRGQWWNFRYLKAKNFYAYKKDIRVSAQENFVLTCLPLYSQETQEKILAAMDFKNLEISPEIFKILDYRLFEQNDLLEEDPDLPGTIPYLHNFISVVLGVGNLRPHRAYPLELWADFILDVLERTDLNIHLLGGPDEEGLSAKLIEILQEKFHARNLQLSLQEKYLGRVVDQIGNLSLLEVAQVLDKSQHVYSADTGLLHIAAALDCEISSIFSITSEHRTAAFHPDVQVLRSADCACKPDNSNSQKHCKKPQNNYAGCAWNIAPQRLLEPLMHKLKLPA